MRELRDILLVGTQDSFGGGLTLLLMRGLIFLFRSILRPMDGGVFLMCLVKLQWITQVKRSLM